jgi:hypothetical protein
MGILKGLKAMQDKIDTSAGGGIKWLKIPDGSSYKIRFLDDLDESTPQVDNGAGVAVMLEEHTSPKDFRKKALCSKDDEGRCWACEQAIAHPKTGWAKRGRVYVNVLVNDGVEDPYVAVWSMGVAKSPTFETLKEIYFDDGTISDRDFRIKRAGAGTNTTYIMRDLGRDTEPFSFADFERFDLETITRAVSYEDQETFYLGTAEVEQVTEEAESTEW